MLSWAPARGGACARSCRRIHADPTPAATRCRCVRLLGGMRECTCTCVWVGGGGHVHALRVRECAHASACVNVCVCPHVKVRVRLHPHACTCMLVLRTSLPPHAGQSQEHGASLTWPTGVRLAHAGTSSSVISLRAPSSFSASICARKHHASHACARRTTGACVHAVCELPAECACWAMLLGRFGGQLDCEMMGSGGTCLQ